MHLREGSQIAHGGMLPARPGAAGAAGNAGEASYRIRRERRRSARIFPPVWHVGQYVTSCDSYETRRRSSPHTGHGAPYRPCTVK